MKINKNEKKTRKLEWIKEAALMEWGLVFTYSGELVAGVANEHAGFSNGTITNSDTFNEL